MLLRLDVPDPSWESEVHPRLTVRRLVDGREDSGLEGLDLLLLRNLLEVRRNRTLVQPLEPEDRAPTLQGLDDSRRIVADEDESGELGTLLHYPAKGRLGVGRHRVRFI